MLGEEFQEAINRLKDAENAVRRWEEARARESETEGRALYATRKAARNRVAELLMDAGISNITIGHER